MADAFRPPLISSAPCKRQPYKNRHTKVSQATISDQKINSLPLYTQVVIEKKRNGEGEQQGRENSLHTGRPPTPSLNNLGTKWYYYGQKVNSFTLNRKNLKQQFRNPTTTERIDDTALNP